MSSKPAEKRMSKNRPFEMGRAAYTRKFARAVSKDFLAHMQALETRVGKLTAFNAYLAGWTKEQEAAMKEELEAAGIEL